MSEPPDPTRNTPSEEVRLAIGVIVGAHGTRGEVRMLIWTHYPERIPKLAHVYLDEEPEARRLRSARIKGNLAILAIEGLASRDDAESLRGAVVRIDRDQAAPLADDEYYHYQLIGLQVVDEAGHPLGELTDILETGANDVYVVRAPDGSETLLPALQSVILDIDLPHGRMVVRPPEYLEG